MNVFVLGLRFIRRLGTFLHFFSTMRYASAKCLKMKAPVNINLQNQTNDVMVNPVNLVNPDSKPVVRGKICL